MCKCNTQKKSEIAQDRFNVIYFKYLCRNTIHPYMVFLYFTVFVIFLLNLYFMPNIFLLMLFNFITFPESRFCFKSFISEFFCELFCKKLSLIFFKDIKRILTFIFVICLAYFCMIALKYL